MQKWIKKDSSWNRLKQMWTVPHMPADVYRSMWTNMLLDTKTSPFSCRDTCLLVEALSESGISEVTCKHLRAFFIHRVYLRFSETKITAPPSILTTPTHNVQLSSSSSGSSFTAMKLVHILFWPRVWRNLCCCVLLSFIQLEISSISFNCYSLLP